MARIGIYPGSFDPPTYGHLDIIRRASTLVDELIVAIGVNTQKTGFLPEDDRFDALRECVADLPNVRVERFKGLLVHFAQEKKSQVLIRGLRAVSDYEYEFRIAMANRNLAPEIETVFLIARDQYSFLASSVVREVATLGGDYSKFVPPQVADRIARRLAGL